MNRVDNFLNSITMYRLILYFLIILLGVTSVFGFFHLLPVNPLSLIASTLFVLAVCLTTNEFFSRAFNAPTNAESAYISALILALIINPISSFRDVWFFFWAGVLTMSSKYILAIGKKHIFNPVAIAVILTTIGFDWSASWWVGTAVMAPFVLIGGMLIVRKIKREDLVYSFFTVTFVTTFAFVLVSGGNLINTVQALFLNSSLFFLAFIMLTEPLTTPPTKGLQILYGGVVGFLFVPQLHFMGVYSTPELALCLGNVFSYLVSPKYKLLLTLKEKLRYGADILDLQFHLGKKMAFIPGQYMEWTLPHSHSDSRGNRRYFTIASSPTEDTLHLGVKFYSGGSSFKKTLATIDKKIPLMGGQLAGDFTLPKDKKEKCVFIAGGIGITPFRSMIKYLVDMGEARPIILFYANKVASEIAYSDVFDEAQKNLGIKTVYTLTEKNAIPNNWMGQVGRIDAKMIEEEVPDYKDRKYYLSGPRAMVNAYEKILREMGIAESRIKTDFFPGFV